jgi:phage shock protein PspC (stress-responsive transcriptional regulator)
VSSIWTVRRSATDAKLTGLCGGAAQHWQVDPTLVRVGCVVLALSSGIGVVLYLAGWLLLPVEGKDRSVADDLFGPPARKWPREVSGALVVIASLVALGVFGSISPFGFGPALILAAIWYFGYYKNRTSPSASSARSPAGPVVPAASETGPFRYPGAPTPFTEAAEGWRQRVEERTGASATPSPAPAGSGPARPDPVPPRTEDPFWAHPDPVGLYDAPTATVPTATPARKSRSARRLRLTGLAVLALALAGLGVADYLGAAVTASAYVAIALLVVGLTLVAATWWGRAWGILPLGLVLALSLAATTVSTEVHDREEWGPRQLGYTSAVSLPPAGDRLDVGRLEVDLSQLRVDRDLTYTARVGLGSLEVTVPPDVPVRIDYRVAAGMMIAYGEPVAAGANQANVLQPDAAPGTPVLTLALSVDRGQLRINR